MTTSAEGGLPTTLAVSSSTGVMSIAVQAPAAPTGDPTILSAEVDSDRRHAEELVPRIRELLTAAELVPGDLELLAVDVGPGRFTGLRVGLATIRALAFAGPTPVVGATSLEILAAGTDPSPRGDDVPHEVTAVIDARRQEVYQQRFVDGVAAEPPVVGRPADLAPLARGVVVGDGADRYPEHYGPDADPAPRSTEMVAGRHPRAVDLLALAAKRTPQPGTSIRPLYLRDPDAKANIRTRPGPATT
jgi:tRNA threonylcarbamoyladenosine biosynthesis protein TsaB